MEPDEFFHRDDAVKAEFFAIANELVDDEANDYLDKRLEAVREWIAQRKSAGEPADLRSLINHVMYEPNSRGPVIVALCTAMWRLLEKEQANADNQ